MLYSSKLDIRPEAGQLVAETCWGELKTIKFVYNLVSTFVRVNSVNKFL
jgi:hypothetical protein